MKPIDKFWILLWASVVLLFACRKVDQHVQNVEPNTNVIYTKYVEDGIVDTEKHVFVYVIDSCEYIGNLEFVSTQSDYLSHKGNCKFCQKRNRP